MDIGVLDDVADELDRRGASALATCVDAKARDYAKEYRDYHSKPEQKKNRAKRNGARKKLGLKKGDGKEADHKNPLSKGGGNSESNLRAVKRKTNRKKGDSKSMTLAHAEALTTAALILAERGTNGESVCVMVPVPPQIWDQKVGKHKDDPHVTVLYVGEVEPERKDDVLSIVQEAMAGSPPITMTMDDEVSYFPPSESSDGRKVAKMGMSCPGLEEIRDTIWKNLEAAGIDVANSFPEFKPHITLDYIEPGTEYAGESPTGSWTADHLELHGWGDPVLMNFKPMNRMAA